MRHEDKKMEDIISFLKEKGFVFPSSEIYGGLAGVYDFGPMGAELMKNIKDFWWKEIVWKKNNYYPMDSAIFKDPKVWKASGHTEGFSDPMAECKECNNRIRVDKELEKIGLEADEKMDIGEINKIFQDNLDKIKCSKCGSNNFTEARAFNLLIKTNLGNFTEKDTEPVYLPGEACQGIYLNFKNIVDSIHPKIPFGVAQIGKAFRNEISPRNFIFRTREFEQADTQFFIKPNENVEFFKKIKEERFKWYLNLGISPKNLKWNQHKNLVFYAADAWDIEYNFPSYGFGEVEGIHDRTDYDLSVHQKHSGKDLQYNDNGEKFIPWVIETSMGLNRVFLAILSEAYDIEVLEDGNTRRVLRLKNFLSPIKIAIMPLMKKDGLDEKAKQIFDKLSGRYSLAYLDSGSIGKRYRKQDEIGTPYCLTVDYETLEDDSVTIRERDSMNQERVKIEDLGGYFDERLN